MLREIGRVGPSPTGACGQHDGAINPNLAALGQQSQESGPGRKPYGRPQTRLLPKTINARDRSVRRTEGPIATDALTQSLDVRISRRFIDDVDPLQTIRHRSRVEPQRCFRGFRRPLQARPRPGFGSIVKADPSRVPLDVLEHSQQVLVTLDREHFESALPDLVARVVMSQITTDMSGRKPALRAAQVAIVAGPESEMNKTIRHAAGSPNSHRHAKRWLGHDLDRGVIVVRLVEYGGACVSAIDDMIGIAANRTTCRTRHKPRTV